MPEARLAKVIKEMLVHFIYDEPSYNRPVAHL